MNDVSKAASYAQRSGVQLSAWGGGDILVYKNLLLLRNISIGKKISSIFTLISFFRYSEFLLSGENVRKMCRRHFSIEADGIVEVKLNKGKPWWPNGYRTCLISTGPRFDSWPWWPKG